MKLTAAIKEMFPDCTGVFGSTAEMAVYATPQNCEIVARGLVVRGVQAGRKVEHFLVDYKGTLMFWSVSDSWHAGGVTKAHATLMRMEEPGLTRETLSAWAQWMIEDGSAESVERTKLAVAARRAAAAQ